MYRDDWGGVDPEPGMKVKSFSELGFPHSVPNDAFARAYGLDHYEVRFCPSAPRQRGGKPWPYTTSFWADMPLEPDTIQRLVDRGGSWPLMICTSHNAIRLIEHNPTYGDIRVIVLRLNQRVDVRTVKSHPTDMNSW
ncbi:MAG: hypothetical protein FJX72_17880 [Armatimonadetes bacterium]|nr:hypothetical protein [Armatimonadota bacterium]